MERVINFISFILIGLFLIGCSTNDKLSDYSIAVIETTSNDEKSLITYYDDNLKKINSNFLDYAELGTNFYNPIYHDDQVYLVPRGLQGKHDEKKVISLNLTDGENNEYDVNRNNIICTATNEDYLFAGSNLNAVSYLTRIKYEDKSEKELAFKSEYLSLVAVSDQYVIVFLTSVGYENIYSKINIYDIDRLELKKSIDITELGINQTKYCLNNNILYFSNAYDKNDKATNVLGVLDLNDLSLSKVVLECNYPDDIQCLTEDKLLISCTNVVLSDGTKLIELDTKTGEQTIYDLGIPILNIKASKNKLFVLSSEYILNVYSINDGMKLIKSTEHKLTEGNYCSAIFTNDK